MVPSFESPFGALTLPGMNQMLQAARPNRRRLSAFGATAIPLHAQLVLPLPRNRQVRELVSNTLSHKLCGHHFGLAIRSAN